MLKRSYILFVLLATCIAFTGCSGPTSVTSATRYIKLIHMDAQSQSAKSQIVDTDGYLTQWWLADDVVSLKAVNDRYFAIGVYYDVILVDVPGFKPVKEFIYKNAGEKNNFLYPWYRVWNTYTRSPELTSDSLLKQSTLQTLRFDDPLNPSFQTLLTLNAQRTHSSRYIAHDITTVRPYRGHLEVSARTTIYDLVTDSLNSKLYANPYYETVSLYTDSSGPDFTLKSDFHPDLPYHTIDYDHFQGLVGDHYAFLTSYDHILYVQDLSKHVTRKVHGDIALRKAVIVADGQLIFATSTKIFRYNPSTDQTEVLYAPSTPFDYYDLSMLYDGASGQLFASFASGRSRVRCIRINLADKSVTDLYSAQLGANMNPLISNFIQINGQYYTTIFSRGPN